jgi:hypothetical protein
MDPQKLQEYVVKENLDVEHENITQSLLMENPSLGRLVAGIRAMCYILKQERQQNHCRLTE